MALEVILLTHKGESFHKILYFEKKILQYILLVLSLLQKQPYI